MKPASPCISVCVLDPPTGWCRGCARTLEEITDWMRYTPEQREEVWARLPARRLQLGTTNPEG
ncbi:MAG: DUF1289 domain-containing protein [Gammaproteobacteria bacterium]|nr:DUF1289 domain-containing protein [Gammaproteobacteria bacterium]MBI5618023.1 DUF1289 domain-containing protein [Gammaproteobacteria bacterium]